MYLVQRQYPGIVDVLNIMLIPCKLVITCKSEGELMSYQIFQKNHRCSVSQKGSYGSFTVVFIKLRKRKGRILMLMHWYKNKCMMYQNNNSATFPPRK
jgi:hypothetical protein